jgi:hypothetical protein
MNKVSGIVTEKDFQATVEQAADLLGWWSWHDNDSRRNAAGFPDLVLVKDSRLIFAELKREKGRLTTVQANVLEMLSKVETVESHLWRPSDWTEIVERLQS